MIKETADCRLHNKSVGQFFDWAKKVTAMPIEVLRIGQRPVRDDRVTTHVALVSRAFGASKIYMTEANPEIKDTIDGINRTWGGQFKVTYVDRWRPVLQEKRRHNYLIIHLSMYGESINDVQDVLYEHAKDKDVLVVVGAKKVPRDVYDISDYNVSVGNQPHSEISALAVLLDRMHKGRQFETAFSDAKLQIIPSRHGKNVVVPEYVTSHGSIAEEEKSNNPTTD